MKKIKREFFQKSALKVARNMLGKYLVRETSEGKCVLKIVETEAYMGVDDDASHSYRGRLTDRNKVMYENGGVFYIYSIYGIYYCLNVVTNKKNIPQAVFIRAAEPLEGVEILKKNRNMNNFNFLHLANGPSKIAQALGLNKEFYGRSVENNRLYFLEGEKVSSKEIALAPRINIDYAQCAKDYPWRFFIKGNKFISKKQFYSL
ncbi:MAG: DNA-3-methyladenine glycosylase [Candidatus Saelkia tenebricola]|nr:DNA-3-methyladenine glycosylase [Candidatus Saelkia tenebricola]